MFLQLVKAKDMIGNGRGATEEVASLPRVVAGCTEEIIFDDNSPADVSVTVVDVAD